MLYYKRKANTNETHLLTKDIGTAEYLDILSIQRWCRYFITHQFNSQETFRLSGSIGKIFLRKRRTTPKISNASRNCERKDLSRNLRLGNKFETSEY